jgi:FAD/FMN-containing dehydrogenase
VLKPIPWQKLKLDGELSLAESERERYAEDASVHRAVPQAVAYPKNTKDLERIVAFCRSHSVPIHGWGMGTSRGGQPVGSGLSVNFRRYFSKIIGFDKETNELTVECSALYSEVQKYLRVLGRSFPPDPSYHQVTIGGMVANNAAGIHSVKYGGTIEHITGVEFLTTDGLWHSTDTADELSAKVDTFLRASDFSDYPDVEKNSAGYSLTRGITDGKLDLAKLFCGSEGTLALFSHIRLRTVPLAQATSLAILYFDSLEAACQAAMDLRIFDIAACELVDKVLLDLHAAAKHGSAPQHAKKIFANPFLKLFWAEKAEAILIVETEGETKEESLQVLMKALHRIDTVSRVANSPEEAEQIWNLRRHTSPILNRLEDGKIAIKPLWGVEDVSLPTATFLPYLKEQKELFVKHGLTCSFFGHAGSCNLHIDPIAIDPRVARQDEETAKLFDLVAKESYELVVKYGGSISGEHGDGIARTPYLKMQYPKSHALFSQLKKLFDPSGILNPGKIAEALKHA